MDIYECSIRSPSVAAAGTYNIIFTTGARPAIFVARTVGFSGASLEANVYEDPTGVAGGTVVETFPTDIVMNNPSTSIMRPGATVTTNGTKRTATTYYRGSTGNGNAVIGTYSAAGGTRRLKGNTTYILQFTNTDSNAQTIDIYFRWYEGGLVVLGG